MNNSENVLQKRIRNLERLAFSIVIFVVSFYAVLNPDEVLEKYGEIGLLISVTLFLISYLFSTIYFINVTGTIIEDVNLQITEIYEKHKSLLNKLKIPLIVILGILATRFLFKFEWNIIFGSLTLMLIGYVITLSVDKSTWLKDKLGIKYKRKKEEQSELLEWD